MPPTKKELPCFYSRIKFNMVKYNSIDSISITGRIPMLIEYVEEALKEPVIQ